MEIRLLNKVELQLYLSDFCELYRKCFKDSIDENIVKQRYIDNPYEDLLMCVAFADGKIIANYCTAPCEAIVNGKKVKVAISLNTMTDPAYAGQGLFVNLASVLYDYMKQCGYAFVYGFPNYLSNKTFTTKLGWKNIYEIPTLEYRCSDVGRDVESSFLSCAFENLSDKDVSANIEIIKDMKYLKWRFETTPDRDYLYAKSTLGSWVIYKFYQNQINIIETNLVVENDVKEMISFLKDVARKNNKNVITVWCKTNMSHHYYYERLGFINNYPVRYFGAVELNKIEGIDLFDYRNWLISMGDDNVY